ncbi:MAG: hypothetical protein WCA00_06055 [Candidatus Acidiferrales bacterium]
MGFSNQKDVKMSADAPSFSADIFATGNVWAASMKYKAGWKAGPPSITAITSDALMGELMKLDNATKFYRRSTNDAGTLSAKDAAALEMLRTSSATDAQYRSACRQFKQPIQPRQTQAATGAAQAQQSVSIIDQLASWPDFQREHGEIFQPPFGDQNVKIIAQYLMDEGNLPSTPANLEQAYRELKAANCFRDARTLTRGMSGSFTIVQPYSHERILQLRNQQAAAIADAPPAGLSDVDMECWRAVHQAYPALPVNSAGFKQCCRATLELWATNFAKEQDPSLAAANKKGELRAAADKVLAAWVRQGNSKLKLGGKGSVKLWLD